MRRLTVGVLVATLALGPTSCAEDDPNGARGDDASGATRSPEPSATDPSEPTPSESEQPSGTPEDPAVLDAVPEPLDWRDVPGPMSHTVTVSGQWTLDVPQGATTATLDGSDPATVQAPPHHRITDALIDGRYAVVVSEDTRAQQGNVATVIDLDSGDRFTVDGRSEVPTTTGGTWALGEGRLAHATIGPGRAYCLATVELADRTSTRGWCAPARHGFNDARITPAGTSLLTFDDQRPSCRTLMEVSGRHVTPFEAVPDCSGWDALLVPGGAVWSVVPQEKRIEEAHFYARSDDGWFDLGPGTSGSLTWCGGAAYFAQDPQRDGDPARLLRWSPEDDLTVAYETSGRGPAFLSAPRCGGDTVTVSVLARSGDAQVTAPAD